MNETLTKTKELLEKQLQLLSEQSEKADNLDELLRTSECICQIGLTITRLAEQIRFFAGVGSGRI